jgi:histone acetyltransferase (RNA polymerase elongator complex component)
MKKTAVIPVFIPHLACPEKCVFCNQRSITGKQKETGIDEVKKIIAGHLETLTGRGLKIGLAFYGGSFTALPAEKMKQYLEAASEWMPDPISELRVSTRPDYISFSVIELLKKFHVNCVELGVQSTDSEVLKRSCRNYFLPTVQSAALQIRNSEMQLGLQFMTGLPGDSYSKSMKTAQDIIDMGPDFVRIYPAIVLKDTEMEQMFLNGSYKPWDTAYTIELLAEILPMFMKKNIPVIRMGLHPSENLFTDSVIAGPEISGLRDKVMSRMWMKKFRPLMTTSGRQITLRVHPSQINHAIGFASANRIWLETLFEKVNFEASAQLKPMEYVADYC